MYLRCPTCGSSEYGPPTSAELAVNSGQQLSCLRPGCNFGGVAAEFTPDESGPLLKLPEDEVRIAQLQLKLAEYEERASPYRPAELEMRTICKIEVLASLLANKEVYTFDLSRILAHRFGNAFSARHFTNACAVIEDYCNTGGAEVRGGTGLKVVEP